jgi:hypothetical protein
MIPLEVLASISADDTAIVLAVVGARLLVPLLIPRFPLIIVIALVLDAADQTIFQEFTELNTGEDGPYQGYDKALDIYYLTIAYLSMLRNWTSDAAFRIGQFLYFYRLVGVTLFELIDERILLLIFPNTFEYFFIAYELLRLRWDPAKRSSRFWLLVAAGIWIFIKLPQEYWIHIAKLDTTELIADYPIVGWIGLAGILGLLAFSLFYVRPRMPVPDWRFAFVAPRLPATMDEVHERHAHVVRQGGFLSGELFEKAIGMLSLIVIIFAQILPGIDASPLQLAIGVTFVVAANTAISHVLARRARTAISSAIIGFPLFLAGNVFLVYLASVILSGGRGDFALGHGIFFAYLISMVIWLYDRYKPVHDARFESCPIHVTSLGDFVDRVRERRA